MPSGGTRGPNGDTYTDDNGIIRYQTGLLPQNGTSPAHWGARANDSSGNPVWDSQGLIAVMKNITTAGPVVVTQTGTGAFVTITNCTTTFTTPRPLDYLVLVRATSVKCTGVSGNLYTVTLFTDGGYTVDATYTVQAVAATPVFTFPVSFYAFLPAVIMPGGLHTFDVRLLANATDTMTITNLRLDVFQLGN